MSTDENPTIAQLFTDAFRAGELAENPTTRLAFVDGEPRGLPVKFAIGSNGEEDITIAHDVLHEIDMRRPAPRRREGTVLITELDTFIEAVSRYKAPESVVWANIAEFSLCAIFNEHPAGGPADRSGWRDHRAVYTCPRSVQWIAWTANDGKAMAQEAFADFIEERLEDVVTGQGFPPPADVLAMARDLRVLTKGTFQRTINPTTGASILVCKTETDTGSTQIPRAFLLAIPVFDGDTATRYQVEARVRFQLVNGQASFSYTMHRRKEIERDAFGDIRERVASGCTIPVWAGRV